MEPHSQPPRRDRSHSGESLESLTSGVDLLLERLEVGVRSTEIEIFADAVAQITRSRQSYQRAVPRMIELLSDPYGDISYRAAQVLIARPHWIGAELINDQIIPRIRQELESGDSVVPLADLIFGLTPGAAQVEDRNVKTYFGMAQVHVRCVRAAATTCHVVPFW